MEIFHFGQAEALYALVAVPFLCLFLAALIRPRVITTAAAVLVVALSVACFSSGVMTAATPQDVVRVSHVVPKGHTVVGLFDLSGSESVCITENVGGVWDTCTRAFVSFRDLLVEFIGRQGFDRFGLVTISDDAKVLSQPKEPVFKTVTALKAITDTEGGTELAVGLKTGLDELAVADPNDGVLLIMSDGDGEIKPESAAKLVDQIKAQHAQLYFIRNTGSGRTTPTDLEKLVEWTGGRSIVVNNPAEMRAAFDRLSADLAPTQETVWVDVYADLTAYFGFVTGMFGIFVFVAYVLCVRQRKLADSGDERAKDSGEEPPGPSEK